MTPTHVTINKCGGACHRWIIVTMIYSTHFLLQAGPRLSGHQDPGESGVGAGGGVRAGHGALHQDVLQHHHHRGHRVRLRV